MSRQMGDPTAEPNPASVILFDGMCPFCSGSVRFILNRDHRRSFTFAPLQSSAADELLSGVDTRSGALDSLVLVENGQSYAQSTAALRIVRKLSGLWPLLYVLIVCPPPLRDLVYDGFARNRYRWFGRHDVCFVPSADERERFLA
jgi:predicted DCC family thiol-disulfide oxidoreductase YuxK